MTDPIMKESNRKKVIVITGASSGIGKATALEFARLGNSVVLLARRGDALERLAEECKQAGGKALALPVDMTYENDVKAAAQKAADYFGKIDVWINNAAVTLLGPFEEIPLEDFKRVMDINVFGYINGARAVLPYFRKEGKGTIINVSSIVGVTGQPFSAPYTISKFAIRGLSLSLEQELADQPGIHVCSVLPGVIDTPLFNQAANYMGHAVKPPSPALDAEIVSKKIVKLADRPKKEISAGAAAKRTGAALLKLILPGMFDKKTRERVLKKHFKEDYAPHSKGNLYDPMPQWATVSGGWKHESEKNRAPVRKLLIAGATLGGTALGAYLVSRRIKKVKSE